MSTVLVLVLALVCLAVGFVTGAALVHLGHLAQRIGEMEKPAPQPEPMVAVTRAMGADLLARSAATLAFFGPAFVRRYVDEMKDTAVLQLHVLAAMHLLGSSPEFARQAHAVADEWMVAESWNMPTAERPSPSGGGD
jgi:hypothetical protein